MIAGNRSNGASRIRRAVWNECAVSSHHFNQVGNFAILAISIFLFFSNMYNWEGKEAECYRLYVEEKKSLDEVAEYWAEKGFTPR